MERRFLASVGNWTLGNLDSESMTVCDKLAPVGLKRVRSSNYPWIIPEWMEKLDQRRRCWGRDRKASSEQRFIEFLLKKGKE